MEGWPCVQGESKLGKTGQMRSSLPITLESRSLKGSNLLGQKKSGLQEAQVRRNGLSAKLWLCLTDQSQIELRLGE